MNIKRYLILIIFIVPMLLLYGCDKSISNLSEEDAIKSVFGEYGEDSKSGVESINYSEEDKIITINYVFNTDALEKTLDKLNEGNLEENEFNRLSNSIQMEISKDILNKVELLYKNNNIDKINIVVYVEELDRELSDLYEFTFDRNTYNNIDWKSIDRENYYYNTYVKPLI